MKHIVLNPFFFYLHRMDRLENRTHTHKIDGKSFFLLKKINYDKKVITE